MSELNPDPSRNKNDSVPVTARQQLRHLMSKREEGKIEGKGYGAEAVGLCRTEWSLALLLSCYSVGILLLVGYTAYVVSAEPFISRLPRLAAIAQH